MKFTYQELDNMQASINALLVQKMPIKITARLKKLLKVLEPDISTLNTSKIESVQKHGGIVDPSGRYSISAENNKEGFDNFVKELNELHTLETNDITFELISLSEIPDISLTVLELQSLEKLFKDE